jgi:5-methylcytosine-specific restriction endonuclease McrA
MWASSQPAVTADESVKACVRGIRDRVLRQKVTNACPEFVANSTKLQTAAASDKLHDVRASDYSIAGLSRDNLLWLYIAQLSRRRRPGREIYDQIMVSAPHGLCCYCRHNIATTLDHFVPKTTVPGLSIDPWNLVPACADCNHSLLDNFSEQATEQMLHPYFVSPIGRWLAASVIPTYPVTVQFEATPDTSLAPELQARIQNQFALLELGRRYSIICSGELVGLGRRLTGELGGAEPGEVASYLSELAALAFETDQNDRRGAMFEALAADEWYCAGGYELPSTATS